MIIESQYYFANTSLAAPWALAHRLQRRTACNTSPPAEPKMADGVWHGVSPSILGRSRQLSLNKFLDPSTPSMRKVDDGEKKKKKKKEKK